jgi:hypothetical protein
MLVLPTATIWVTSILTTLRADGYYRTSLKCKELIFRSQILGPHVLANVQLPE